MPGLPVSYARVISKQALDFLQGRQLGIAYGSQIDTIPNREGTGRCPTERLTDSYD